MLGGNVNTISKINGSEREGLEHQRVALLEQLKELQFRLFDKSAPEVSVLAFPQCVRASQCSIAKKELEKVKK